MDRKEQDDYAVDVLAIASGYRPDFDDNDSEKHVFDRESAGDASNLVWRTLACIATQEMVRHCIPEDKDHEVLTIDWLADQMIYREDLDGDHSDPYTYAHYLLLCERFEEAVDYILM